VRVLVTGATGFTGGHLARHLASRGQEVAALVRTPASADHLKQHGIEIRAGDLRDRRSLAAAVKGIDVVYNIAAVYRQAGLPAEEYELLNGIAVGMLIDEAAAAAVRRVVHCSTVGVHGEIKGPPANEDAPFHPDDVYQRSKLTGEKKAHEHADRTGIELTIVRPSGIYGPRDRRFLKLFRSVARGHFVMLGTGGILYHLTHVDDIVEGMRLAGETGGAAGRTYILAGPEAPTLKDVVRIIAEENGTPVPTRSFPVWPVWIAGAVCEAVCAPLGLEPPLYRRRVEFFTKSRAFDISRARQELRWEPTIGVREGIRRTLAWYRESQWL
jgi:nucleoside-diphosphate-sugar epimerase